MSGAVALVAPLRTYCALSGVLHAVSYGTSRSRAWCARLCARAWRGSTVRSAATSSTSSATSSVYTPGAAGRRSRACSSRSLGTPFVQPAVASAPHAVCSAARVRSQLYTSKTVEQEDVVLDREETSARSRLLNSSCGSVSVTALGC
jgi:hypothetical protein